MGVAANADIVDLSCSGKSTRYFGSMENARSVTSHHDGFSVRVNFDRQTVSWTAVSAVPFPMVYNQPHAVMFKGSYKDASGRQAFLSGTINRLTGLIGVIASRTEDIVSGPMLASWDLMCKPTHQLF